MVDFEFKYNLIYLSSIVVGVFILLSAELRDWQSNKINMLFVGMFLFGFALVIGGRDFSVGYDTLMNVWFFEDVEKLTFEREAFFGLFLRFLHLFTDNAKIFLYIMSFIYTLGVYFFVKNFSPTKTSKYFLFISIISLFFFKTMGINIIRQGISVVLLLNAFNFYLKRKYVFTAVLCILAMNFHLTIVIPIAVFFLARFVMNIWMGIGVYTVGIIMSYFGIGLTALMRYIPALSSLDPRFESYITNEKSWVYEVGFKPQFVVFNTFFLLVSLLLRKRIVDAVEKVYYNRLINYYTFTSFLFFMAFQIAYSDRWGIFPWISIPVLMYPLMKLDSPKGWQTLAFMGSFTIFVFFNIIYKQ